MTNQPPPHLEPTRAEEGSRHFHPDDASGPREPPAYLRRFELSDADWEVLLDNIEHGRCTPFLGAGASVPSLPLGSQLADQWAETFHYPLRDRDLSKIAQFVAVTRRDGLYPKTVITRWFKTRPYPDFDSKSQVHRLLAEFPLPVYVTTNYDDFMLRALRAAGKDQARHDFCRWNDDLRFRADDLNLPVSAFGPQSQYEPSAEEPIVFHMHGHKDFPESMVLTEDDYVDFLIAISQNEELLPPRIIRAFSRSTLLFVGYSLADWNFRLLFRKLVTYIQQGSIGRKRPHLSVQVEPFEGCDEIPIKQREQALEYLSQYYNELNIRVFWGNCEDFAKRLRLEWEKRRSALPTETRA